MHHTTRIETVGHRQPVCEEVYLVAASPQATNVHLVAATQATQAARSPNTADGFRSWLTSRQVRVVYVPAGIEALTAASVAGAVPVRAYWPDVSAPELLRSIAACHRGANVAVVLPDVALAATVAAVRGSGCRRVVLPSAQSSVVLKLGSCADVEAPGHEAHSQNE